MEKFREITAKLVFATYGLSVLTGIIVGVLVAFSQAFPVEGDTTGLAFGLPFMAVMLICGGIISMLSLSLPVHLVFAAIDLIKRNHTPAWIFVSYVMAVLPVLCSSCYLILALAMMATGQVSS